MSVSFCPVRWLAIEADHPTLAGHFPGRPIVPGVVLLDNLIALLEEAAPGARLAGIPVAKFVLPVEPGVPVLLGLDCGSDGRARFICRTPTAVAARGTFVLAAG